MAEVHEALGERGQAIKIRERIVQSSNAIQGPQHVSTGDAMARLAELLYSSDRFQVGYKRSRSAPRRIRNTS